MDDLIGLTPGDHGAIGRMLIAFESGQLTRREYSGRSLGQRVYESVSFINTAAEIIPAYGIMRITTPTTVDGEMVVNVAKPDGTYRWRYLVNGPEDVPAASGSRGWGTFAFDSDKILYDTGSTPAVDEEWGPKSGEWKLFQHRPGFILDGRKDSTAGWLYAMQVIPAEILVKNDSGGDYSAGSGPSSYKVFGGTAGSETDTGLTISAYNRTGVKFANGKFGGVVRINGKAYACPWECPA